MALAILSLPIITVVIILLKPFRRINKVHYLHNKLRRYMKFGHPITVTFETYTVIAICSLINILNVSFVTKILIMFIHLAEL
jgi:hypothetical protein